MIVFNYNPLFLFLGVSEFQSFYSFLFDLAKKPCFIKSACFFCICGTGFYICVPISLLFLLSFWCDLARRSHIFDVFICICVSFVFLFLLSLRRDLARRSHIFDVFICICISFVFLFLLSFRRDLARRSPASSYGRSSCLTGFSHGLKIIDGDLCQDGNDDGDDQDHENHDQDYDDGDDDHNYQHYDDSYNHNHHDQTYLK